MIALVLPMATYYFNDQLQVIKAKPAGTNIYITGIREWTAEEFALWASQGYQLEKVA